jgi:hypothetical protein
MTMHSDCAPGNLAVIPNFCELYPCFKPVIYAQLLYFFLFIIVQRPSLHSKDDGYADIWPRSFHLGFGCR